MKNNTMCSFVKKIIFPVSFSLVLSCNSATFFTNEEFTWQNDTIKMNDGSIKAYAPDAYTIIS